MCDNFNYIEHRINIWNSIKDRNISERDENLIIKVKLSDGREVNGKAGEITPAYISYLTGSNNIIVAKVDGNLVDLNTKLNQDCDIELLSFDSPEGQKVFWHSSAHILGQALEIFDGGLLCTGPPISDNGFYYDFFSSSSISQDDFTTLNEIIKTIIKEKQLFERLVLSKEDALEIFKYNKYKLHIINEKIPDGGSCTAYRCGPFIDLCKGPHVLNTGIIKSMDLYNSSSSHWLGNSDNDSLQRVYGISFPKNKQLKDWKTKREEALKRDHRVIGKNQELFFFHSCSPGSAFFLPHGTHIYNKLIDHIRQQYRQRGFKEVITPNIYSNKLFELSGHWDNYHENMYQLQNNPKEPNECFVLKPMNCPAHCLLFSQRSRSYKELPLRIADFGVLHRNELSGALSGLTRVRRFQQDDAHIFCKRNQIKDEIIEAFNFLNSVYSIFNFTFDLELSTRPDKYIGSIDIWNDAENALIEVLNDIGYPWKLNTGDGAFYGPKIDIHIKDALGRSYQCGTIQLDFNLPSRLNLEYVTENGVDRPIMIHRAILGSVERFMGILIEHLNGKWPLWLSPRQLLVIPISDKFNKYAELVQGIFFSQGFIVDVDLSDKSFQRKMIHARKNGFYNYYLVVGKEEETNGTVNVRSRDNIIIGVKSISNAIGEFIDEVKNFK